MVCVGRGIDECERYCERSVRGSVKYGVHRVKRKCERECERRVRISLRGGLKVV